MATYNLSITTDDPGELAAIVNGITGSAPAAETPTQPRRGRPPRAETPAAKPPAGTVNQPHHVNSPTPPVSTWDDKPAAPAPAATITEADLIAAANKAVEYIGGEGPAKLKGWLAANFKCADGTPGKLKQLAEDQKAGALSGLKAIAEGKMTL